MDLCIYSNEAGEALIARVEGEHVVLISKEIIVTKVRTEKRNRILATIPFQAWRAIADALTCPPVGSVEYRQRKGSSVNNEKKSL